MSSCALCVPRLHRLCKHIGPLEEEVVQSNKTKIKTNGLLKEMKRVCDDLEKIIEMEKLNIGKIDKNVDSISGMIQDSYERCVKHLTEVKERQLNHLAEMSKDSKLKLEASVKKYENQKVYFRKWQEMMERTLECGDHTKILLWYSLMEENVEKIQKMKFKQIRIDLTFTLYEDRISEIENVET